MAYTSRGGSASLRNTQNGAQINVSANTGSGTKFFGPGYSFIGAKEISSEEFIVNSEHGSGTNGEPMKIFSFGGIGTKGLASTMEKGQFIGICNVGNASIEVFFQVKNYDTVAAGAEPADLGDCKQLAYVTALIEPGRFLSLPNIRMLIFNTETSAGLPHSSAVGTQVTSGIISMTDGNGFCETTDYFSTESASSHAVTGGLTPGSISINFYSAGYQEFGITNTTNGGVRQTSSSTSGLSANTAYRFRVTVDGTATDSSITTDTSDVTWGNASSGTGVLKKINDVLNASYLAGTYTYRPSIGIVDGDIRVTSGSRKSTSAIAFADATGGSGAQLFGSGGVIPAVGDVDSAVAAALEAPLALKRPTDSVAHLMVDKANGTGRRTDGGTFNMIPAGPAYNPYGPSNVTMQLRNCPRFADFKITYCHNSAHSGIVLTSAAASNAICNIYARSVNPNVPSKVKLFTVN